MCIDLQKWLAIYEKIRKEFNYSKEKDREAARLLSELIKGKTVEPSKISELINGKQVLVFGAGPSLQRHVDIAARNKLHKTHLIIAADGATSALMSHDIVPDIITTDLDGDVRDIIRANKLGAIVVIHAHGDNIQQLRKHVPNFNNLILGSTQVEPLDSVYNFGGFTDGDRAVFLACKFNALKIILAGMDFGRIVGKFSKPEYKGDIPAPSTKVKKLEIAKHLIELLAREAKVRIVFFDKFIEELSKN